jgi:hypothetical protein
MLKTIPLALAVLALAGCAFNPMTPDEFRKGTVLMKPKETFVVDRPFPVIAASLRKRAPDCLDLNLYTQQKPTIGFAGSPRHSGSSKSTVLVNGDRAELYLQVDYKGDLARRPAGGNYYYIADAEAIGPGKTRVDIYRTAIRSDVIHEAVKGWINGTTQGCPDPQSFL